MLAKFQAGHAGGGGLRRGAYRMGVQAEAWGWALGQPMGLRWGVQSVDWASKTRGRAPVGRCAWRFPGDTPEFEFRRVASFEIYATLSTSATLIPSLVSTKSFPMSLGGA